MPPEQPSPWTGPLSCDGGWEPGDTLRQSYVKHGGNQPNGAQAGLAYLKHDAMGPLGDAAILLFNPGDAATFTVDLSMLPDTVYGTEPVDLITNAYMITCLANSFLRG